MSNIVEFTGLTKGRIDPKTVVKYADDLTDAVVIGWQVNGELYVAGSTASVAEVVYALEIAKNYMLKLDTE